MNVPKTEARRWAAKAVQFYFGRCDICGRTREKDDRHLMVARQEHRLDRECFDCWDERVSK